MADQSQTLKGIGSLPIDLACHGLNRHIQPIGVEHFLDNTMAW